MSTIEISNDERETLVELLTSAIGDLGYEIANTDSFDFRSGLKAKRAAAQAVLERLQQLAG